jgi:quercetin dioxygenase-like cupin family protein
LPLAVAAALFGAGCATHRGQPDPGAAPIVNQELLKTTRSWDGRLLPRYPRGQPEVTIRRITIPPGAKLEPHLHPVINAGVLLSGRLTVLKDNGQTLQIKAGDAVAEVVDTWHYGTNPGKVPAEILVVYAGAVGVPTSVAKPAALAGTWSAPSLSQPAVPIIFTLASDGTAIEQVGDYRGRGRWSREGDAARIAWDSGWSGLLRPAGGKAWELATWKKDSAPDGPPDDRQQARRLAR